MGTPTEKNYRTPVNKKNSPSITDVWQLEDTGHEQSGKIIRDESINDLQGRVQIGLFD